MSSFSFRRVPVFEQLEPKRPLAADSCDQQIACEPQEEEAATSVGVPIEAVEGTASPSVALQTTNENNEADDEQVTENNSDESNSDENNSDDDDSDESDSDESDSDESDSDESDSDESDSDDDDSDDDDTVLENGQSTTTTAPITATATAPSIGAVEDESVLAARSSFGVPPTAASETVQPNVATALASVADATTVDLLLAVSTNYNGDEPPSTEFVGESDQRDAPPAALEAPFPSLEEDAESPSSAGERS